MAILDFRRDDRLDLAFYSDTTSKSFMATITNAGTGLPVDLTTAQIAVTVKKQHNFHTPVLELSLGDGLSITGADNNQILFAQGAFDGLPVDKYVWSLDVTIDGFTDKWITGNITVTNRS